MNYPISIQNFEELRTQNYTYIDKSRLVYELAHDFKFTILRRPPLFGKSLLLSTLKAYFEGKEKLFEGLSLMELQVEQWVQHPVLVLDFVHGLFNSVENFRKHLSCLISRLEAEYGEDPNEQLLSDRLSGVIRRAYGRNSKSVVILIDDYDKPLRDTIGNPDLHAAISEELNSLYGVFKEVEPFIKFAFLTGVTNFGHLNSLNLFADLTFDPKYADICGFTQEEIDLNFEQPLQCMAQSRGYTLEQMKEEFHLKYDGYHFTKSDIKVYNPFSILNATKRDELANYWFDTQNPYQLFDLLKAHNYLLSRLDDGITAYESQLKRITGTDTIETIERIQITESDEVTDSEEGSDSEECPECPENTDSIDSSVSPDPIPIAYQNGFLTIKEYDPTQECYRLCFPNQEVRKGFLRLTFPYYSKTNSGKIYHLNDFVDSLYEGEPAKFIDLLVNLVRDMSIEGLSQCRENFQNLIFIILTICTDSPALQRISYFDSTFIVVETPDYVYLLYFDVNSSATEALNIINERGYAKPWENDSRMLFRIGANYSTFKGKITEYLYKDKKGNSGGGFFE